MEYKRTKPRYEDMEPTTHKVSDVVKSAQKIAVKTQRAFHAPLTHFVPQPKDEKLMDEDFVFNQNIHQIQVNNTNYNCDNIWNVENKGFNDAYTTSYKCDDISPNIRSHSDALHYQSRRPIQNQQLKRNVTKKEALSKVPSNMSIYNKPSPNGDIHVKDKRADVYKPQSHHHPEISVDDHYLSVNKPKYDPWVNTNDRSSTKDLRNLSFHKIVYKVKIKKYPWSKVVEKIILDNVSGIMLPGLNAIMGPSGSGKSSILDVLAGRKDPQYLKGSVLINGAPQPKNFKCMSGYVVQDDIVMGTLTVQENLMFSAALRLPATCSKASRADKVKKIIDELGLTDVANSKIGTELIRGVSGGERKRCNIGMELITDPNVLFLDEPTTGLDASTASAVINILQKLSHNRIIILSIHQPKYSIYRLFDRYTLMAKGKVVYHGPAGKNPSKYFRNLGYELENYNNPPDFYMDIIHGDVKSNKEVLDQQKFDSSAEYVEIFNSKLIKNGKHKSSNKKRTAIKLINEWQACEQNKKLCRYLDTCAQSEQSLLSYTPPVLPETTNWLNQLRWVCWRTGLNIVRNPQTSVIQLGVYLFFAFSMGIVYFGLTTTNPRGYQDRYGLFYFSALQVIFVNLGAIEIFIKERPIFIHENSSGYYQVSSYFLAKLICDMVPIKVLPAIVFLPITYFMAKLRSDAGAFFYFELILLLTTSAGCSIAFFVSSTFSVFGIANVVTPIIYVFMMVFSGFLISIDSIFPWLNWCRYLSAFRFAIAGLAVNELNGTVFCQNVSVPCMTGNNFLDLNAIPHSIAWDLWVNPVGLFVITVVFLILCYVQLRRMNKYR